MGGRLIDADAIISFVSAGHLRNPMEKTWSDNEVVDMIESRPTVDAVPVVRCKDCIEYRDCVGACHYFNYEPTDEMDFCSHGIRADGERISE